MVPLRCPDEKRGSPNNSLYGLPQSPRGFLKASDPGHTLNGYCEGKALRIDGILEDQKGEVNNPHPFKRTRKPRQRPQLKHLIKDRSQKQQ